MLVTCDAGAGSPPAALLGFDGATSATTPHLAKTLLAPGDNWLGTSFRRPRCCPDITTTLAWTWQGDAYVETGPQPPHQRL